MNPNDFWRNLDGKRIAIAGGAVFLGLALLDNAYRDGLRTGLLLASQGEEVRWRDLDHGFPFGPWLFIAVIVGFVGWRKGWWGGNGNRPSGPNGHGRSLAPPAWAPRPPATPPVPPTPAPSTPSGPPAWEAQPQPRPQPRPVEVRIPVMVAGQAPAATAPEPPASPVASAAPSAPPSPTVPPPPIEPSATPAATPEAIAPEYEYRRTVGEAGKRG